ncbi:MAG: tetratricopeptide repeat protein [Deltaproteobacteria bacterium]|nr:tetratricopeptide repeat protein [Deltaproteobacteria bacterium]
MARALGLVIAWLSAACAATPVAAPVALPGDRVVHMETMAIQAKPDPLTGLETYDASDLLAKGNEYFDAKSFDFAIAVYTHLERTFPDSELVANAIYNIALCYESLVEPEKAVTAFSRLIATYPNASNVRDAEFRMTLSLGKLARWQEVADLFWKVRQRADLTSMDQLEARVGAGIAAFNLSDMTTAEQEFLGALSFYDRKQKEEYLPAAYWIGQARFHLGEIYARKFEALLLDAEAMDPEAWKTQVAQKLEDKCEQLLRAQSNLIRAIRSGHAGWATAAGYRIGSLYERLYDDIMGVPAPPGLSAEAVEIYREELTAKLGVLVSKAIQIYEQSLQMAERVGEANTWVERTERALERMRTLALASMKDQPT